MKPTSRELEITQKAFKELFNPEPHPFQMEWSDAHSMTSENMLNRFAQTLSDYKMELVGVVKDNKVNRMFDDYGDAEPRIKAHDNLCDKITKAIEEY